ncbi:MAG: LemA family protein, partial [Pseudomonadota bacterium]
MEFLIIILLFAAVIGGYVYCYNSLVTAKTKVDEGWSGITVQLKRRHELVPNLVSAARTAMSHESGILDRILDARTQALAALAGGNHE